MPSYGIGFQPGGQGQQQGGTGNGPAPLESVVKLLSLRLPSVVGARGIAPNALMQSPGMAGVSGGMGEQQWLQVLQQLFGAQGGGQGAAPWMQPSGQAGTPRVVPGIDDKAKDPGDIGQIDLGELLRRKTGGNTGIGNTGSPQGPLMGGGNPLDPSGLLGQ